MTEENLKARTHSDENELRALHKEAVELTRIFTASIRTAERNLES